MALLARSPTLFRNWIARGAHPQAVVGCRFVSRTPVLRNADNSKGPQQEPEFEEEYEGPSKGRGRAVLLAMFATGAGYGYYSWDEQAMKDLNIDIWENEHLSHLQKALSLYIWMFGKVRAKVNDFFLYFTDPPKPKLLPDLVPSQQPILTIVLDLEDTLVHTEWDRQKGLRPRRRPHTTEFLQRLVAAGAEIVIFSSSSGFFADGIVQALDPRQQLIHHRLGKEYTLYRDGKHIKDLSRLNRDLARVVIIDDNPESYELQPENAIPISSWEGDRSDTALKQLAPFLEHVMATRTSDVRRDIAQYKEDPNHFNRKAEARVKKQAKIASFLGIEASSPAPIPAAAEGISGTPRTEMKSLAVEAEGKQGRLWQWLKRRNDQSALREQQLQEEWMDKMAQQKRNN